MEKGGHCVETLGSRGYHRFILNRYLRVEFRFAKSNGLATRSLGERGSSPHAAAPVTAIVHSMIVNYGSVWHVEDVDINSSTKISTTTAAYATQ